jgi:hypothetical protein
MTAPGLRPRRVRRLHAPCAPKGTDGAEPSPPPPPPPGDNARDKGFEARPLLSAVRACARGARPVTAPGVRRRRVRSVRAPCTPTGVDEENPHHRSRPLPATMHGTRVARPTAPAQCDTHMSSRGADCDGAGREASARPKRTCAMNAQGGGLGRALTTAPAPSRRRCTGQGGRGPAPARSVRYAHELQGLGLRRRRA